MHCVRRVQEETRRASAAQRAAELLCNVPRLTNPAGDDATLASQNQFGSARVVLSQQVCKPGDRTRFQLQSLSHRLNHHFDGLNNDVSAVVHFILATATAGFPSKVVVQPVGSLMPLYSVNPVNVCWTSPNSIPCLRGMVRDKIFPSSPNSKAAIEPSKYTLKRFSEPIKSASLLATA